jgi:hypothetical protein
MSPSRTFGFFLFLCAIASSTLYAAPSAETFSIEFSEHSIRAERHVLAEDTYDLIKMDDLELTKTPGHPCLPVKAMTVYVPRGSRISCVSVESVTGYELPGEYVLLPAQQEIPLSEGFVAEPVLPDESIYSLAEPYPASPVRTVSSGAIGGRKVAAVQIFPIQYVPAEHKIVFNSEIRVAVEFEDAQEEPAVPMETRSVRKLRNRIVRSMVENPVDLDRDFPENADLLDPSVATEYLIICIDGHADEYEVLKDWKTRKGVPAKIVTQTDVLATYPGRDEQEQFRNCIKDYYLNESTVWVVLTTSAPKAKIRGCYCSVGGTVDTAIPCDLYFADMDGDWNDDGDSYWGEVYDDVDLYPDVYTGRLSPNKGVQCTTVVRKILTYEGRYPVPTDYQSDMLFLAEYADASTDGAVGKNLIDTESVPARFDPITKLYESSGNLNWSSAMNALNAGTGVINHDGHGNAQVLSIGPSALDTDDMMSLTNHPRYSVFYTVACIPGNFENVMGCFGRGFLESPEGGGFFVGNSRYGWYWPGNPGYGTGERFDREFFASMFVRGYSHLGVIHADAKVQRIPWSGGNGTDRWTQFTSNLFGDPETPVWLDTPVATSATHPTQLVAGNHSFPVTVYADGSPLEGARVCLWMGDDLYLVEETDASGDAQFTIAATDSGEIKVTATKSGYLPYLGSIAVTGGLSGIVDGREAATRLAVTVMPNPVTGSAVIKYSLPRSGLDDKGAALKIYDASGRLVKSLSLAESSAVSNTLIWDGSLERGGAAPSGIYFIKISHGRTSATSKFVMLR